MYRAASLWRLLRARIARNKVQLGFALRVTIAAILSLIIAQYMGLRLPLWSVLTAVVVMQVSVGASLRSTVDYLLGTMGGAIYGSAVGRLVAQPSEGELIVLLAIGVAPMAVVAAFNPRLRVAPVTAIIVLLLPTFTQATSLASAIDRILEVAVGGITGFLVSLMVLPSRAHSQAAAAAARTLDDMARALRALMLGLSGGLDTSALHRIQDGIGRSLNDLSAISVEAEHERRARLADKPDTGPLRRTLLRIRHDLVMIGRACQSPIPGSVRPGLEPVVLRAGEAVAEFLAATGAAFRERTAGPTLGAVAASLDAYHAAIGTLRKDGLTRSLTDEGAERFFALLFAFEQLRQDLADIERCAREWAEAAPVERVVPSG